MIVTVAQDKTTAGQVSDWFTAGHGEFDLKETGDNAAKANYQDISLAPNS